MRKFFLNSIFILFVFSQSFAGKTSPIVIEPLLTNFDSLPLIQDLRLFINNVEMSTENLSDTLGYTRTGRKTKAPIVFKSPFNSILKNTFSQYLNSKDMNVAEAHSAQKVLNISVLSLELTETSSGLTQTMTATLKVRVSLIDPNDETKKRTFIIETQNSKKTFDTTKSAEFVVSGVIEGIIKEIMKTVSQ